MTRKGDQSAAIYYNKMKDYANEMAAAGKPLEDEDFVRYLLAGLDQDYNSCVENIARKTEISLGAVYSQLLAAEERLELQNSVNSHYQSVSLVNSVLRGCGGYRGRGGFGHGFGGCGKPGSSSGTKPVCQLCKKIDHTVLRCWKRFDRNFTGEDKMVNNAENLWYNIPRLGTRTLGLLIILLASWTSSLCVRITWARTKSIVQMEEVCKLLILLNLHFIPLLEIFLLIMSYMFLTPRKT
jgi:hypothetical protein